MIYFKRFKARVREDLFVVAFENDVIYSSWKYIIKWAAAAHVQFGNHALYFL